jgi:hypothetical protein
VNEQEWLNSTSSVEMLEWAFSTNTARGFLANCYYGKRYSAGLSERKLRLYAVALCRQIWDGQTCPACDGNGSEDGGAVPPPQGAPIALGRCPTCHGAGRVGGLTDPRSRAAVEVAEKFADGEATKEERQVAHADGFYAPMSELPGPAMLAASCCGNRPADLAVQILPTVDFKAVNSADLLRCVVGNPFRPVKFGLRKGCYGIEEHGFAGRANWRKSGCPNCPGTGRIPPSWLTRTVLDLARATYQDRCPTDMMHILADPLEEVGCPLEVTCPECGGNKGYRSHRRKYLNGMVMLTNVYEWHSCVYCGSKGKIVNPIIAHLRGPGPHARGCWVVDAILGKS